MLIDGLDLAGGSADALAVDVAPADVAYVMFTLGSTGRPKGVMVEHRSVVRLVCGQEYDVLGPEAVQLTLAPLAFDATTWELWGPLIHGGRLVVAPPGGVGVAELGGLTSRYGVRSLLLTTSLFNAVADEDPGVLTGLERILVGGEACRRAMCGQRSGWCPGCKWSMPAGRPRQQQWLAPT